MKSFKNTSKLSPFSNQALSDASTLLSDDCVSSSRSSTPTSLFDAPGKLERCGSSSSSSTRDGSLPGSVCADFESTSSSFERVSPSSSSTCDADEESQQPMTRRERGSSIKRRPRAPDHLGRISLNLAKAADFNALAVSKALAAASNQDGVLTEPDLQDVFQSFGLPSSDALIFFNLLDTNGNGTLYWREIVAILAPLFKEVQAKQDCIALSIQFKQEIMKDDDEPRKFNRSFSFFTK